MQEFDYDQNFFVELTLVVLFHDFSAIDSFSKIQFEFDLISVESCSEEKKNRQSEQSFKNLVRKANVLHHCKNIAFKEIFLGNHYCTTDKYLLKDHLLSAISKGEKVASPALFLRHFW